MEGAETVKHILHPLMEGYFIDKVELSHTVDKDYWLGKPGSEPQVWLSNEWSKALELAEVKIG